MDLIGIPGLHTLDFAERNETRGQMDYEREKCSKCRLHVKEDCCAQACQRFAECKIESLSGSKWVTKNL